ncbi:MAG: hypothetical protein IPL83_20785 [Bdellovibrionales bacterium]|nr:hypothetical protein [Bdellovibrionales bacterium]
MAFDKVRSDRLGKILSKYRKKKLVHLSGLILAAAIISLFYSNCGDFNALRKNDSPSTPVATGESFFANDGAVIGNVERLVDTGSTLVLSGWACVVGSDSPAVIEIGAADGSFGTTTADSVRENAVKVACNSTNYNHGFSFEISAAYRNIYEGKEPYVRLNGTAIPLEPNLIITAVPSEPVTPTMAGYLDAVTYASDGSATATGWACLTGTDQPVNVDIVSDTGYKLGSGTANAAAGLGVKAACGSSTINHGFSIQINSVLFVAASGSKVKAVASSGGQQGYLIGEFPLEKKLEDRPNLPFTAKLDPSWTGPGGSTWNHSATLNSADSGSARFSINSSSSNDGLIPSFLEQKVDITVTGNGCHDVGQSNRTSAGSGDSYVVTTRACFTKASNETHYYWDISFTHRAFNLTANVDGGESASHGTILLRPTK